MTQLSIAIVGLQDSIASDNGQFIRALATRLAAKGHEVTVYYRKRFFCPDPGRWPGVRLMISPTLEFGLLGKYSYESSSMLLGSVASCHLLFVCGSTNRLLTCWPRLLARKTVLKALDPTKFAGTTGNARISKRFGFYHRIIVDSEEEVTGNRCEFIPSAAEIEKSVDPRLIREIGLEPGQYYLTLYRSTHRKILMGVAESFLLSGSSKKLVILDDWEGAESRGKDLHLSELDGEQVRFLGAVHDPDLARELYCNTYAWIDLGLTNLSLLRALASGACVLARDTSDARVILAEGEYGLFWRNETLADLWRNETLAHKIREVEEDAELAQRFRDLATRRIQERYSWDLTIDQYEELFRQVVG